ncbi:NAD(P)H-dependent oxidoreductase [Sphingobium boeckii]|uniref:FMN dependent NADH:quinone oxidoreductase n=1 Tax=Sphingobium boeckii TaxID=1082345 RepID=A0A7W9AFT9_9SPHN|nr:FMN-dependent NADH-azoreductase [Sphingobium boeckii]
MKLLHIDASIHTTQSISRNLSAATVDRLKRQNPDIEIQYLDLSANPLHHITGRVFAAHAQGADITDLDPAELHDVTESGKVLEEFLASDIVVLGVPFYNFSIPSSLKAWIDRIIVAGKTFSYGANGVVGLAGEKRLIVLIARGGVYSEGSPSAHNEHGETYLKSVFSIIGIDDIEIIVAEGVAISPQARDAALQNALDSIETLAA